MNNNTHYEVEMKAFVDNSKVEEIKNSLDELYQEASLVDKIDEYYFSNNDNKKFRVRRENDKLIYTYKKNKNIDCLELNEETEVEITNSDYKRYKELSEFLYSKIKTGYKWSRINPIKKASVINIELLKVSGGKKDNIKNLGYFLEIEILSSSTDDKLILEYQNYIKSIFDKFLLSNNIVKEKYETLLLTKQE